MIRYELPGLVTLAVCGDDPRIERNLERRFGPYRSDGEEDADVLIEVGPRTPGEIVRLGRSPVALKDGRPHLLDHLERACTFPVDELLTPPWRIRAERGFEPAVLVNRILQPLLRLGLALHRDTAIVHAAGFDGPDGPVLVCGWSGAGKTGTMLGAVGPGGRVYGNDWVPVDARGTVYPYSLQVNLYRRNLEGGDASLGRADRFRARLHGVTPGAATSASRALRSSSLLSRGMAQVADMLRNTSPIKRRVDVLTGAAPGAPQRLAKVVLLDDVDEPTSIDRGELVRRVLVGQRFETADFWQDSLAAAYALGGEPAAERLFAAEAEILERAFEGAECVRSPAALVGEAIGVGVPPEPRVEEIAAEG